MAIPKYPYTNFHELNLDWLIEEVKKCYSEDNPPPGSAVLSVNGETGAVILYKNADVRLPSVDDDEWQFRRYVSGNVTAGILFRKALPAQRMTGGNRYDIYDAGNPPPYPVTSVNGQTGAVNVPVPVQSVNGQTGNVNIVIPVQSVNGQTGAVVVPVAFRSNTDPFLQPTDDVAGAQWGIERGVTAGTTGISFEIEGGHVNGYINFYDNDDQVIDKLKILTPADIPSSSGVVSVNGRDGVVTGLYDANNPPPYPVTSVNGQTGAVIIQIPVTSINGNTGAVVLTGEQIPTSTTNNRPISETVENAYEHTMEDIAIVVIGNKTLNMAGASVGQYVVVRDSTIANRPDGLYTAIQTIPYNTVITSAYLSTPISGGAANALNNKIQNKLSSLGYVSNPDLTRAEVMALNPTDAGNIYMYVVNYGYNMYIGFVHKTLEYGGQLKLSYTDGMQFRKYYNGTWSAWE